MSLPLSGAEVIQGKVEREQYGWGEGGTELGHRWNRPRKGMGMAAKAAVGFSPSSQACKPHTQLATWFCTSNFTAVYPSRPGDLSRAGGLV